MRAAAPGASIGDARLLLVTDYRPDLENRVRAAARGGLDVLQFRGESADPRTLAPLALQIREVCEREGVLFTVNDDLELARLSGAAGVHLGQKDAPSSRAREILGSHVVVGGSAASLEEAIRTVQEGADYVGVGAVYPSRTKPDAEVGGLGLVHTIARAGLPVPWFAIGGITLETAPAVAAAGAPGFAVGGAILDAEDPEAVACGLKAYLL